MDNQYWSNLGEDIRSAVQAAVDTKDFRHLNEVVSQSVKDAMATVGKGLDNVSRRPSQSRTADDSQAPYPYAGSAGTPDCGPQSQTRGAGSAYGGTYTYDYTQGGASGMASGAAHSSAAGPGTYSYEYTQGAVRGGGQRSSTGSYGPSADGRQTGARTPLHRAGAAAGRFAGQVASQAATQALQKLSEKAAAPKARAPQAPVSKAPPRSGARRDTAPKAPPLYAGSSGTYGLGVMGLVTTIPADIVFLIFMLIFLLSGRFTPGLVFTLLFAGSAYLTARSWGLLGRIRRFRATVAYLGTRTFCRVDELAGHLMVTPAALLKDLRRMILDRWFIQGHVAPDGSFLFVTEETYQSYLRTEQERLAALAQEQAQQANQAAQAAAAQRADQNAQDALPAEVRAMVDSGNAYLAQIKECNSSIADDTISAKISRIEELVGKILSRVRQNPASAPDLKKFMDYYLPTTVKLLVAYRDLDSVQEQGANINTSKQEIESTLDTINTAFENLLDQIFQATAWDISSDISVLNTMLAKEGLAEGISAKGFGLDMFHAAANREKVPVLKGSDDT
ncbi:MAG: 5-bromo-4-chloroindolyl phosphate hydrolysis family protein [Lachnospiraceae bacterium]|jgi:hypothetical protein|nr:5-bromo-4-chloroindolyl phosphate hydrolysis family protein [Lachnospiraceae bacterium]